MMMDPIWVVGATAVEAAVKYTFEAVRPDTTYFPVFPLMTT
jgi:hypothetical protein